MELVQETMRNQDSENWNDNVLATISVAGRKRWNLVIFMVQSYTGKDAMAQRLVFLSIRDG